VSRLIQFRGAYFNSAVIIPPCITAKRKPTLFVLMDRPWAAAIDRLLKRRGVKPVELSAFGLKRPGTISDLRNQPKRPDIQTLQHVADVLTAYDRRSQGGTPHAPAVELWEFFVSEDQAELLYRQAAHTAELMKPPAPDPMRELVEKMVAFMATPAGQEAMSTMARHEPPRKKVK